MGITANRPSQHMVDLVGALGGTWLGYKAMCRCPAHADKTPSLSIRQGDRGLLVTCFPDPADADLHRRHRHRALGAHEARLQQVGSLAAGKALASKKLLGSSVVRASLAATRWQQKICYIINPKNPYHTPEHRFGAASARNRC